MNRKKIKKLIYFSLGWLSLINSVNSDIISLEQKKSFYRFPKKNPKPLGDTPLSHDDFVRLFLSPFFISPHHLTAVFLKSFEKQFMEGICQPDLLTTYGFEILKNHYLRTVVKHPAIPGYIFKIACQGHIPHETHYNEWTMRITGSQTIEASIKAFNFEDIFSVPKKWLYPLPKSNSLNETWYILIAEDMYPLFDKENVKQWKQMDASTLDKIFKMVCHLKLWDTHFQNLVFTETGKLAFVDTKHWGTYKPLFASNEWLWNRIYPALNTEMQAYWLSLWGINFSD
ncbi:hypothetical protein [Candidatus Protochlamydia amoebophila]|uniref:PI3K/PI4K catalytic domain-containing protein n=1 Tax=Protochlamydia amoebophila (strain UWE25) TaxID=264201 RepID=Q6MC01_PARUW|nr:hypothetical protein [Candidatus Protochlamydia amoebophila]CAF23898.1 unnamed protein product [Candidatus Protochlamydia amoebophila UWE25]